MHRTRHVLGVFQGLVLRAANDHQHIAGAGFADGRGFQVALGVLGIQGVQVAGQVADVHQAAGLGITRVQFDELEIVEFDEGFGGLAVSGHLEGLLEAELLVKRARRGHVGNAKGDMRDAAQRRGLRPRKRGQEDSDSYDSSNH